MNPTVEIVIRGTPEHVEAVTEQCRRFLRVVQQGRDTALIGESGKIKRTLRVRPPDEAQPYKAGPPEYLE